MAARRVLTWLAVTLAGLVLLLAAAAGAFWWWAGTPASLDWSLRQLATRLPALTVEGARGTLRTGLEAQRLAWQQEGLRVEARNVVLAWQPLPLAQRLLKLDRLQAERIEVQDRRPPSGDPPAPPASLVLPVRIAVDELAVARLVYDGRTRVEAQDVDARYVFDGRDHRADIRSLRVLDGSYKGQLALGARPPFPLQAGLQGRLEAPVPGGQQRLPLVFDATLRGPLADLQARVQTQAQAQAQAGAQAPRATVTARLTPFAPQPVPQALARFEDLDLGVLWRAAPQTQLAGELRVQPAGPASWTLSADVRNAQPGPWDRDRLPVAQLRAEGEWRQAGQALVRSLQAQAGGGRIEASGEWLGTAGWRVQGTLAGVDPAALHSAMAPVPVSGRATVQGEGEAIAFDADLRASGARRRAPARDAGELAAAVGALELREAAARGRWAGGRLSLPALEVRTADAQLQGSIDVTPATWTGNGKLALQAPGLQAQAQGTLAQAKGAGAVRVTAADLALAQRWLQGLPGMPEAVGEQPLRGRAELDGRWLGGWSDPTLQATLLVPQLTVGGADTPEAQAWTLRDTRVRLDGRLAEARLQLQATALQGERRLGLQASAQGGRQGKAWQALVQQLVATASDPAVGSGRWTLDLRRALDVRWSEGTLTTGAGEAALVPPPREGRAGAPAQLAWEPVRWGGGSLRTAGRLSGLPLAWLELLGGPQLGAALAGDLVFDARWQAALGEQLDVRASLVRTRGDLTVLAETAEGGSARVPAGVRDAQIALEGRGENLTVRLRWDSERAGTADGTLTTRLARGGGGAGWQWPEDAPLNGTVQAQLPRIGVWSVLAPPGWRLRGSLGADVRVAGTRGDPQLGGSLRADDLALRSIVDGVALRGGRLRARLDGRRLLLDEFVLRGAGREQGGLLTASGEGSWGPGGPQVRVQARLDRLRASVREDRQLTVSGDVGARLARGGGEVTGRLVVDQASIVLPDETAPRLGDDVVVRNAAPNFPMAHRAGTQAAGGPGNGARPGPPLAMDVALDLGNQFRVQGRGIQTRLAGTLALQGPVGDPRLNGVITTVGGEYRAYGQRLDIERGVLRFTGPLDNPALDVLAVRPRIAQRVGVQVTGRAQAPYVRLYSEPELAEAEKLSWLVLGRASASGGAEAALLQQAATALIASRTGGGSGRGPAALLGLDELSFRRNGEGGPAVTLGRRFGDRLYAAYERSLSGALGTLYLFYDISQRFTLRAEAGERTAVDLIWTFAYD